MLLAACDFLALLLVVEFLEALSFDEVSFIKNKLLSQLLDNDISMLRYFGNLDVCWWLLLNILNTIDIIFIL